MRIAIDAMGGDHAPKEIVLGAMEAVKQNQKLQITLIGDENKIKEHLVEHPSISIIHTQEYISSDDEPVKAVRRKKQASMVLAAKEVKEGRADACISAGNTGALMTAGLLVVGRMKGIERPALAPTLPTKDTKGFLMLDVGANMDAKALHLYQYAIMASVYCEKVRGIKNPRIGLLNVGSEDTKGNELMKEVFAMLKNAPINFIGNVEARDLLVGGADAVVCDGFSGNIALKSLEGTALTMFSMIKDELMSSFTSKIGALLLKSKFKKIKQRLDYSEYGGAMLFGLQAPVIKAHGSSDAKGIVSAIKQTEKMLDNNVISIIQAEMSKDDQTKN